jgi:hypothetical protein
MNFPSIDIQGSILSADLLGKIRAEQASFQAGKDFKPDYSSSQLKEEISLAWQEAKGQWKIFQSKLQRLKEGDSGTTETRNFWMLPLMSNLGYNLHYAKEAEELNGKSFFISYRDANLENFPLYVAGFNESLDKRPESKQLRVSPHALVQEYLNYSEHLYGLVSNGRQLRLLRDASRLTRLSYVEFNLEKMMEEDLYPDFVILYRLLHASRMPERQDASSESIIEQYHQDSLEAGATIRAELGIAVKRAIETLANGFINHPDNKVLREAYHNGQLDLDAFYRHQLRIIYRLLFLFVIEERNLVYAESKTPETRRFNKIYFRHYSLMRLRKLAKNLPPPEAERHHDLWLGLVSTFSLFEDSTVGAKMGIMALKGDLFSYDAIACGAYDLHTLHISNAALLRILKSLSYFENDRGVLVAVNYGGLDVEEFGSVYEGLLELKLSVQPIAGSDLLNCCFAQSNERSKSGSHYTPEELVQPLIKHSLEYLIEDRIKPYHDKKESKEKTVKALLDLKICDVACGSGHILLSAARRVALELARIQTDEEQPNPTAIRKALREVIRHCIYGVDKNPLAVELCKVAFWLEAHNPGEPLNFLDHHIKCGDAIVGLAHKEELQKPIPDEAFNALPGDDKTIASSFKKANKKEREGQLGLDFEGQVAGPIESLSEQYAAFEAMPENTAEEIEAKRIAYERLHSGTGWWRLKTLADIQVAQFFIPKKAENHNQLITTARYTNYMNGTQPLQDVKVAKAQAIAIDKGIFHWFLEFPEVSIQGGFDCILGNPPFRGGLRISIDYGEYYTNYIKSRTIKAGATTDLVAYFFLRAYDLINRGGYLSLIGTNSISEGDTRETCLEQLLINSGVIVFAVKSTKWIGAANLYVSLISIAKQRISQCIEIILGNSKVKYISSRLDSLEEFSKPFKLINSTSAYCGTTVYGKGFFISESERNKLLEQNNNRGEYIMPILNGEDILNNPDSKYSKYVLYFQNANFSQIEMRDPHLYKFAFDRIYHERQKSASKGRREKWWLYTSPADDIYEGIKNNNLDQVLVTCFTSKHLIFGFQNTDQIFSNAVVVFLSDDIELFGVLQSSIHFSWVKSVGSTLESRIRYAVTDCYDTYPVCPFSKELTSASKEYHEYRLKYLLANKIGLTTLYNHLHDISNIQIQPLRSKLIELDYCVLDCYGWGALDLKHGFYEDENLPENDRIRFTIHPDARKEVLKRLLELNHKIHEEEVKAGLWEKKPAGKGKKKVKENKDQTELF